MSQAGKVRAVRKTGGAHMTALDKRAVREAIEAGANAAATQRNSYRLHPVEGPPDSYRVVRTWKERSDTDKVRHRRCTSFVQIVWEKGASPQPAPAEVVTEPKPEPEPADPGGSQWPGEQLALFAL